MSTTNNNNVNSQDKKEQEKDLIMGGILNEDNEDFSIPKKNVAQLLQMRDLNNHSAPPGLLYQNSTFSFYEEGSSDYLKDPIYHEYYRLQKNPRLPKPIQGSNEASYFNYGGQQKKLEQELSELSLSSSKEEQQSTNAFNSFGNANKGGSDDNLNLLQPSQHFQGDKLHQILPNQQQQQQQPQDLTHKQQFQGGNQQFGKPNQQQYYKPHNNNNNNNYQGNNRHQQRLQQGGGGYGNNNNNNQRSWQGNHQNQHQEDYFQGNNQQQQYFQPNPQQNLNQFQKYNSYPQQNYQYQQQQQQQLPGFPNQNPYNKPYNNNYYQDQQQNDYYRQSYQQQQPQYDLQQQQQFSNKPYGQNHQQQQPYNQYYNQYPNQYYQNNQQQGAGGGGVYPPYGQKKMNSGYQNQPPKEKVPIETLLQDLLHLCKDQHGSRTIQDTLDQSTDEEKDKIFKGIKDQIQLLMSDVFGNYVIQRILEKGLPDHKQHILELVLQNVKELSFNTYGCRVIQKALDEIKKDIEMQKKLIQKLEPIVIDCIQNANGNHVIQRCFETLEPSLLSKFVELVIQNIQTFAYHSYGCRVIQKILEHFPSHQYPNTQKIYDILRENMIQLCECQFGNYIMQYIIEKGPEKEKNDILKVVRDNFILLSMNKFASHVSEKSIIYSDGRYKDSIVDSLLVYQPNSYETGLLKLMKDQFGNYVVQKLLEHSDPDTKNKIWSSVTQYPQIINELDQSQNGRYVISYLQKYRKFDRI